MQDLSNEFYSRSTLEIAKSLLGCILVTNINGIITSGKIVETEGYLQNDPAAHSFRGPKKKNLALFGEPGRAYIYFTYGMYYCFNVVTNKEGIGEGVLIRSLEPLEGIEEMRERRGVDKIKDLCSGPAKLVIALGITPDRNGSNLVSGPIRIYKGDIIPTGNIVATTRVGISNAKELLYRFYIKDSEFISKK